MSFNAHVRVSVKCERKTCWATSYTRWLGHTCGRFWTQIEYWTGTMRRKVEPNRFTIIAARFVCQRRRMGESVGWTLDKGTAARTFFFFLWMTTSFNVHTLRALMTVMNCAVLFTCEILLWLRCNAILWSRPEIEKNIMPSQIKGLAEILFMTFRIQVIFFVLMRVESVKKE